MTSRWGQSLWIAKKECPNLPAFGDVPYLPAQKERPQVTQKARAEAPGSLCKFVSN